MTFEELALDDCTIDFRMETKIYLKMKKEPSGAPNSKKTYMQVETTYVNNPPRGKERDEPDINSWDATLDVLIPKEGLYNSSWKLDPQDMDEDLMKSNQTHVPLSKEIVRLQKLIEKSLTESEFINIDANSASLTSVDADAQDWAWTAPVPIAPVACDSNCRGRPQLRYKMMPQCRLRERLQEAEGRQTRLQQRPQHDLEKQDELAAINDWLKLLARAKGK